MDTKAKLSLVVTARNDNYGGNWINRINTFIKVLIHLTNRYQYPTELVFVEYNPVPDKPNLYEELTIRDNAFLTVRFVVVPNAFHARLPDHEKVTVCEFIAKNIGIRRANGEYVLATNPDVIFSESLFETMIDPSRDPKHFFRVNRHDLSVNHFDERLTINDIYEICRKSTTKILFNTKTQYVSYRAWLNYLIHSRSIKSAVHCPLFNRFRNIQSDEAVMHENAAGDFLLASREAWNRIRGYDQMTVGSGVLDSYAVYMMHCHGYVQKILLNPLYHINHHHGGVRYLASHAKLKEDAKRMMETKIPYKIYREDWGFPEEPFQEVVFAAQAS